MTVQVGILIGMKVGKGAGEIKTGVKRFMHPGSGCIKGMLPFLFQRQNSRALTETKVFGEKYVFTQTSCLPACPSLSTQHGTGGGGVALQVTLVLSISHLPHLSSLPARPFC